MKSAITCLLFFISIASLLAQQHTVDVVILKSGDRLEGEILKYEQGEKLFLLLDSGEELEIKEEEIDQIKQGQPKNAQPPNTILKANSNTYPKKRTQGIYFISQLSFAVGQTNEEGFALGAGTAVIVGKQIKSTYGIGIGAGLDNYARRGETVYPVFLDIRTYMPHKNKSGDFYAVFNAGYGFAFARKSIGINDAEGGFLIHPAFGYRTTTKEGVDVNVDAGMKFQKASFVRDLFNGDVEVRDLTFQRFTVRVGIAIWGK